MDEATRPNRSRRRQSVREEKVRKSYMIPVRLARRLVRVADATGDSEASIAVAGIAERVGHLERQAGQIRRQQRAGQTSQPTPEGPDGE